MLKDFTNLQQEDGSFDDSNIFTTLLILSVLKNSAYNTELKESVRAAAAFIERQTENYRCFNYWKNNSDERTKMPLPDDLDDAACAHISLILQDKRKMGVERCAAIVKTLISNETGGGGPYYTWIIGSEAREKNIEWRNIDIGVNANIAYLLFLSHIPCPNGLSEYIDRCIENKDFSSRYYTCKNLVLYLISRGYVGKKKSALLSEITGEFSKIKKDPYADSMNYMFLWLAIYEIDMKILENETCPFYDLRYVRTPLYIESIIKSVRHEKDSSALFYALRIECTACAKRMETLKYENMQKDPIYLSVKEKLENIFEKDEGVSKRIDRLRKNDASGVQILTCHRIYRSINIENKIPDDVLFKISEIHLLGWLSYDIADDIVDESKDTELLPIVLSSIRMMTRISMEIKDKISERYFEKYLSSVDRSLFFEKNKKSPGTYSPSEKSIGHAYGALCVCILAGHAENKGLLESMENFFRHYLEARQLLDDGHDIEEDIKNDAKTFPTSFIKEHFKKEEIILRTCEKVLEKADDARKALQKNPDILSFEFFEEILKPIESSARRGIEDIRNDEKFKEIYWQ